MNRRGFLKAIATVAAGSIILPQIKLIVPSDEPLLIGEKWIGNVREVMQYEISRDIMMVRHDIKIRGEQFHVDSWLKPLEPMSRVREPAAAVLRNFMQHHGWSVADLEPLPLPRGHEFASWSVA